MGPEDVLSVDSEDIHRFCLNTSVTVPDIFDGTMLNASSGLYVVVSGYKRLVSFVSRPTVLNFCKSRNKTLVQVTTEEDDYFFNLLPTGSSILEIYRDGALVHWTGNKDFLVFRNGSWHVITSAQVFYREGWEFSSVINVADRLDIDMATFGEDMK